MRTRTSTIFTTIHAEGGLLPASLLQRIADGDGDLTGLTPEDYHLIPGERLNEVINRSWNRALAAWESFRHAREHLPESDAGTTVTRERWLLPLFQELGYGRLQTSRAIEIEGKNYPVSHFWEQTPIHLVSFRLDPDRRTPGATGASRTSPHGLVQEFLNRSDDHLWAFLSNGLTLRILRDNVSLTRQAFVEFDLDAMMEGEVYADFAVLWLLCHQSRVEAPRPEECWLEKWCQYVQKQGIPALEKMRDGVEKAIASLGRGFISYHANRELRDALYQGGLDKQEFYRQLLRVVYRLIFLFVAEDRDLLFHPDADPKARETYTRFYSVTRLRRLAERRHGSKHVDLGRMLFLVFSRLGDDTGCPVLGLPALGSFLWSAEATAHLNGCDISNADVLAAIRELSFTQEGRVRRPVDYKNLGAEELGSIYESLLELHPEINADAGTFELTTAAGHERKTTGSYYTHTSLITCLLYSTLDPVLDEACRKENPEKAILTLKVCDPACGSGHFLVAAAHWMAKRLAAVRSGDNEPAPDAVRTALRDVIGHCIYGVDINPMSVELCKVSLWLESLEPGKPLSFLDHHIRCGNSLLGVMPALLSKGIPDDAFKPIDGDDADYCKKYKAINKQERKQKQMSLLGHDSQPWEHLGNLVAGLLSIDDVDDQSIAGIRERQRRYDELVRSSGYAFGHFLADSWCAAFIWNKSDDPNLSYPITEEIFRNIEHNPFSVPTWLKEEVLRLAQQFQFFHWHLEFPSVFRLPMQGEQPDNKATGWCGGFDVILGNPPWDEIQFEETAWFASRDSEIASATSADERSRKISELRDTYPELFNDYRSAVRFIEATKGLVRNSGTYPNGSHGKLNTYVLFTELNARLVAPSGMVGCVIPTGLATDKSTQYLFEALMAPGRIRSLYDFVNEKPFFPEVRPHQHFCLLTLGKPAGAEAMTDFTAFLVDTPQLTDDNLHFELNWKEVVELNPEGRTLTLFPSKNHADVFRIIASQHYPLGNQTNEGDWEADFRQGTYNMASASGLFKSCLQLADAGYDVSNICRVRASGQGNFVPLFDAKMARQYEWRAASLDFSGNQFRKISKEESSLEELQDPSFIPIPTYWVPENDSEERLRGWSHNWLLGFKEVTGTTSTRMAAFAIVPRWGIAHKFPLVSVVGGAREHAVMLAWFNSLLVEYVLRQRMQGVSLTWHLLKQMPTPSKERVQNECLWSHGESLEVWISLRVAELSVTAWPLVEFAQELGLAPLPFRYAPERRTLLQAELDAAWFQITRLNRDQVEFVLDYLEKVRASDMRACGEYRTKRLVLEAYDRMGEAIATGGMYETMLVPPPADPSMTHSVAQFGIPRIDDDNAYPGNDWERATCAFTLALVGNAEQDTDGLLTALVMAANPDLCAKFLPENQQAQFRALVASVPQALFTSARKQLDLRMLSAHLANLQAITRAPSRDRGEIIRTGSTFDQECINLSADSYQQLAGLVLTALAEFKSRSSQEVAKAELLQLKETMVRAAA